MFDKLKYVTDAVHAKIPVSIQLLLWAAIDTMIVNKRDYLQVFNIKSIYQEGVFKLCIVHTQEEPNYVKEHSTVISVQINEKLYVIDIGPYSTMLLAIEYCYPPL
ncbi:hypothetical protein Back11_39530 [Paenibacillus baekrokdamisoli]|uniref:Uncharacterized protein n=1 Tax=Paenibacillus baekrokdamisoli TaxID=1712516 RepID=A0A3G9JF19_9BACL|nr:DUF960 family protein [Paenibacillus baekrokdamisoli]MBB3068350.1 hypothetical protein [Paenibacillus baekrokdamisoli]BBH22608.1 hypothetical protein Back11_39530 [Paenibacillus baekrokdamisoli]